jgi:hypothetical protein
MVIVGRTCAAFAAYFRVSVVVAPYLAIVLSPKPQPILC